MKLLLIISFTFFSLITFAQKKVTINGINKDSVRFYIGFQKINERFNYLQAAQKFNIDDAGSFLQQVVLYRAIIPVNNGQSIGEPASTTFLLKIYSVDSLTGSPGTSLIKEPITVRDSSNPVIKIDLSKYKIIIPGKSFFVGIEWLFIERNQRLMNIKGDKMIKGDRYEVADLIYQPFLGMVKNNKNTSDAWVMTPERKWKLYTHNLPYMTDLSITAYLVTN